MTYERGQIIGEHYEIIGQLGQGGMATVYRAQDQNLGRDVAIKILHPALKQEDNFEARFQREARLVAGLDHPNIVPIYVFGKHRGDPYLVMKYIEGETLKSYRTKHAPGVEEITEIVLSVGDALAYAHEAGLLHRDIKPSNIMMEQRTGKVYLTDFGLARIAGAGESTLSQDMMLGTPQYISPEQAMGDRNLDVRTDVYSLGVVIYELIVGRVPFSADTPFAIVHDHIFTPLPPPRKVNPQVPEAAEEFLLKALAKKREDRHSSIPDMMQHFQYALEASGPEAITAASQVAPRPNDEVIPRSSTLALPREALEEPEPVYDYGGAPQQRRARSRRQRQNRPGLWPLIGVVLLLFVLAGGGYVFYTAYTEELQRVYEEALPEDSRLLPVEILMIT